MSGSSTKLRLTVMFAASASGSIMPPFYVYPAPPPTGVNPLNCSLPGGFVAYTEKGWMNSQTFEQFLDHFEQHIVTEKPVVLLIDSVGSHINRTVFRKALSKGTELYRLVPNATHLMQPLDKEVFGPMKKQWYKTVGQHNRKHPGVIINKLKFAEKLKECYNDFYKPNIVVNSFCSAGIYSVNRDVITTEQLKTNLTFTEPESSTSRSTATEPEIQPVKDQANPQPSTDVNEEVFKAYESVLSTPVKQKYERRLEEKFDIKDVSTENLQPESSMDIAYQTSTTDNTNLLDLLAEVATSTLVTATKTSENIISPIVKESLKLPQAKSKKLKRKNTTNELPDHLTSPQSIRTLENKNLDEIRKLAAKERKAKAAYLKSKLSCNLSKKITTTANKLVKGRSAINTSKGKGIMKSKKQTQDILVSNANKTDDHDAYCVVCEMTWAEDKQLMLGQTWIQCDKCLAWIHENCLPVGFVYDMTEERFACHNCKKD
ncbi:hypothetical protein KUTeg_018009 [Tegillarca granosa]|uniref:PHD-type domain-containing protein n=1 Tax=Tegillarca granosa TaxID=220873 RepID=A0ABQ9EJ32_TEGGR|nr:hypothetical protein KUTeg_018009 [Tegillarca granosa]